MKKFVLKLKMFYFKLHFFITLILFRPKVFFYDKNTKKKIRRHKAPFIVANNHIGYYDTLVMWTVFIGKYIRFVATEEILRNRISRFFFSWNGVITISRGNINMSAYSEIRNSLKNGFWIGITPEGHINRTSELHDFHYGTAQIAIMSRADILPVYIVPKIKLLWRRQKVYIGNPVAPDGDRNVVTTLLKEKITELAQLHKNKTIAAFFKNKSVAYVLPLITTVKEDQLKTTFYKKYSPGIAEFALSKCAWYFLEKIFRSLNITLTDNDITFSNDGKPMHKDICFNISHSKDIITIVLSRHDCSVDCQIVNNNVKKVEKWVRHECDKKLLTGSVGNYRQKRIRRNGDTYIIGTMTSDNIVIKRKIKETY